MKKFLLPFLGLALAFNVSTAAFAQDVDVDFDTTAQVTTSSSTTTWYGDDRFVSARNNAGLTGDSDIRFREVYTREWNEVGPIFTESDMAIRAELQPHQVAIYNDVMTDATRFQLLRMSPTQYQAFRTDLGTRLMLTPAQRTAIYPMLDRSIARASDIHRATYASQYCEILGMERHEAFDREVASVEIFQEEVAERQVEVEVRREAVVETDTEFMRDRDLK